MTFQQQITDQLSDLVKNVTPEDREAAAKELDVNINTINKYLLGDVNKVVFADKLIAFLKMRIAKRMAA